MEPIPQPIRDLYPFDSHYLELGESRMHYVDEGHGRPVVMLHGNPTWSFYYRDLILGLRDCCRAVVPDHIGCGLSDKPQCYPYTLTTHIENFSRLVDHLELTEFDLVVHDWGGAIGFGYACWHPERVRRLVVLNTAAFFGRVPWRIRVCRVPWLGALAVRGLNAFAGAAVRMATSAPGGLPALVCDGYLWPYRSWADRVAVHQFVRDIPTHPGHSAHPVIESIDQALSRLHEHPMLICWGMRDFCFTPAFLDGWVERFPAADVHRFSGAGHYVLEDAGDEVLPLVREFIT